MANRRRFWMTLFAVALGVAVRLNVDGVYCVFAGHAGAGGLVDIPCCVIHE